MPSRVKKRKKSSNIFKRYGVGRFQIVQSILINIITLPVRIITWIVTYGFELVLTAPLMRHKRKK